MKENHHSFIRNNGFQASKLDSECSQSQSPVRLQCTGGHHLPETQIWKRGVGQTETLMVEGQ